VQVLYHDALSYIDNTVFQIFNNVHLCVYRCSVRLL